MTIEEQVQAEAKEMIESYMPYANGICLVNKANSIYSALISINKIISLRVPPMEHYEQIKQAIINYK